MADKTSLESFGDPSKINPYGASEEGIRAYQDSLEQGLKALESRYDHPNWFKVAAGFAKPQLGGFLASLGSASEAMGENVEKQREQQLPVSQMRAQLAQSKILMGQNQKASAMVAEHKGPITADFVQQLEAIAPNAPATISARSVYNSAIKERELSSSELNNAKTRIDYALANHREPNPADVAILSSGSSTQPPAAGHPAGGEPKTPTVPVAVKEPTSIDATNFLKGIYGVETGNSPNATNPVSSASGRGQMIDSTFNSLQKKFPDLPKVSKEEYNKDPSIQAQYDNALLKDNFDTLKNKGLKPTALNNYSMWATGKPNMASENDATPLSKVLSPEELKANPSWAAAETVGGLRDLFSKQLKAKGIDPTFSVTFGEKPISPTLAKTEPKSQQYYDISVMNPNLTGVNPNDVVNTREIATKKALNLETPLVAEFKNLSVLNSPTNYNTAVGANEAAMRFIDQHPTIANKVFNMINNKGALAAAANAGLGIHVMNYGASLNFPVEAMLTAGLTEREQEAAQVLLNNLATSAYYNLMAKGQDPSSMGEGRVSLALQQEPTMKGTVGGAYHNLQKNMNLLGHQRDMYNLYSDQSKVDPQSLTPFTDIRKSKDMAKREEFWKQVNNKHDAAHRSSFNTKP